jgi:hypothetical protein
VRTAVEHRPHVSVRDDSSRDRLLATGGGRELAVVPDPTVLASRLFPADVLRKRLEYLRVLGCYPPEGRPILVQGDAAPEKEAADVAHALTARYTGEAVVLAELRPGCDDAATDAIAAELGDAFRLPARASVEDFTAAIANARTFVGSASSVATGFGVPALHPSAILGAAPETGPLAALQARVDAELDTIAVLAERSWSRRLSGKGHMPEKLAQALLQSEERYRALLHAHAARGERLVSERMRFAEIVERLEASDGTLPPEAALRIAELENAVFTAQASEAEVRFELEQLRNERERRG